MFGMKAIVYEIHRLRGGDFSAGLPQAQIDAFVAKTGNPRTGWRHYATARVIEGEPDQIELAAKRKPSRCKVLARSHKMDCPRRGDSELKNWIHRMMLHFCTDQVYSLTDETA
ncbi:MAG: hypothetical protein OXL96_11825 [Candidatus Poribacteria bacterium]|nr:hypothetical protein [Candidatus Poribacteria bacterium]